MPPARRGRQTRPEYDATPRPGWQETLGADDESCTSDQADLRDVDGNHSLEIDGAEAADHVLATKLVRYAVACESSRTPIRRDGIRDKVLGNHGRVFKRVYALAQEQLRSDFGMELRQLPAREKVTLKEKRQALKSSNPPKTGSGAFTLTTVLPDAYRNPAILSPARAPSAEDEAAYEGFYTFFITLLTLNGGEMSDHKVQNYLAQLNAEQNVGLDKTDMFVKRMEKQLYVVRSVDRGAYDENGENVITWTIGPRGRVEVGADGVAGLVRRVWAATNRSEGLELERDLHVSLGTNGSAHHDRDATVDDVSS